MEENQNNQLLNELTKITQGLRALYSITKQKPQESPIFPLCSEHTNEFDEAFCAAQSEFGVFAKDRQGRFNYLSLDAILMHALPILNKHGIYETQLERQIGQEVWLFTILKHKKSGQWMQSYSAIPKTIPQNGKHIMQEYGSIMTYKKRYALVGMLGIATGDKDLDD